MRLGQRINKELAKRSSFFANPAFQQTEKVEQVSHRTNIIYPTNAYLMKKNEQVAYISYGSHGIHDIIEITQPELLPYKACDANNIDKSLIEWWNSRCINSNMCNIDKIKTLYNTQKIPYYICDHHGTSFLDDYWIKKEKDDVCWADIDPYLNSCSDMYESLLFSTKSVSEDTIYTPSLTIPGGNSLKYWSSDGCSLIKCYENKNELCNELFACEIMRSLNMVQDEPNILSSLNANYFSDGRQVTRVIHRLAFKKFIKHGEVFLSASNYKYSVYPPTAQSLFFNMLQNQDFKEQIIKMFILDFIMLNENRNYDNIGFIIDETGHVSLSPIYSNGKSLYFNTEIEDIDKHKVYSVLDLNYDEAFYKIFKSKTDLNSVEINKVMAIIPLYSTISEKLGISPIRASVIINILNDRIRHLVELINTLDDEIVTKETIPVLQTSPVKKYEIKNGKLVFLSDEARKECEDLILSGVIIHQNQYPAYIDSLKEDI